jgi:hypothetical protein
MNTGGFNGTAIAIRSAVIALTLVMTFLRAPHEDDKRLLDCRWLAIRTDQWSRDRR